MSKALIAELNALKELNPLSKERYERAEGISERAVRLLTATIPRPDDEDLEETSSEHSLLLTNLWRHCFYEPITYNKSRLLEKRSSSQVFSRSQSSFSSLGQPSYSASFTSHVPPALKRPKTEDLVSVHSVIGSGIRAFRTIICRLQSTWGMNIIEPDGNENASAIDRNIVLADEIMGGAGLSRALDICYKSLIFLGDLHRHWFMLDVVSGDLFKEARKCYLRARALRPEEGCTFNQLGALESYVDDPLQTVCFYAMGDASVTPNKLSKANIAGELAKFAKRKVKPKTLSQPRERFTAAFLQLFATLFKWSKKAPPPATPAKIGRDVSEVLNALEGVIVRMNCASGYSNFRFLADVVILETYLCNFAVREAEQCVIARDLLYSTVSRILCSGASFPPASISLKVAHIFLMWFIGSGINNENNGNDGYTDGFNTNYMPERNLWTSVWDSVLGLLNSLVAKRNDVYVDENTTICAEEALLCGVVPYSRVAKRQKDPWKGNTVVLYDDDDDNDNNSGDSPELYSLRKMRLLELGRRVSELGLGKGSQPLYWSETDSRFTNSCPSSQSQTQPSPSLLSSPSQGSSANMSSQGTQELSPQKKFEAKNIVLKGANGEMTQSLSRCTTAATTSSLHSECCCESQSLFILPSQVNESREEIYKEKEKEKDNNWKSKPFGWLIKEWF